MMEPEETELIDWFWWTSCKLFSELGRYANEMPVLGLRDDGSGLAPLRFVQKGEPKQEDIIRHFKLCGVRVQDANEHLLGFSKRYISKVSPPMAIDWSRIPLPNLGYPGHHSTNAVNVATKRTLTETCLYPGTVRNNPFNRTTGPSSALTFRSRQQFTPEDGHRALRLNSLLIRRPGVRHDLLQTKTVCISDDTRIQLRYQISLTSPVGQSCGGGCNGSFGGSFLHQDIKIPLDGSYV